MSWADEYRAGDHERVWRTLTEAGTSPARGHLHVARRHREYEERKEMGWFRVQKTDRFPLYLAPD
jgi:hypothetical protein